MAKSLTLAVALVAATSIGAFAQSSSGSTQGRPTGGSPRSNYVTSTGATVPNPGVSQSGGTTSLDRGVEREDSRIEGSICKGC